MHTYVALLRGINLGGRNRVAMGELRGLLSTRGFTEVRTHLQSGNIVLAHESSDPRTAANLVREVVADGFGLDVATLVRRDTEFADVVARNPLGREPDDPARFLVAFLDTTPDPERARELARRNFGEDRLMLSGQEAYLWCPGGVRDSELGKLAWDRHLGVTATARNWNTVTRLAAMLAG